MNMFNEDINQRILDSRIIFLNGEINNETANEIIMQLLYLDSINHNDIYLYINSNGRVVSQGLAIIDCMNYINSKFVTICVGIAYSMAAVILSCGTTGNRYALPNSEVMVHQVSGGVEGKAEDINLSTKRINKTNKKLTKLIADNSNLEYNSVFNNMKKDYFMDAKEAKKYGIIDKIIFKSNRLTD